MLFFDEIAFIPNIELLYTSAMPSTEMCGPDARILMMSTVRKIRVSMSELQNGHRPSRSANICRSEGSNGVRKWLMKTAGKNLLHWRAHLFIRRTRLRRHGSR